MTVLSQIDFSTQSAGTELDAIDASWVQTGTYALKVNSTGQLFVDTSGSSPHKFSSSGAIRWEIDLYALGTSAKAVHFCFGTNGSTYTTGARISWIQGSYPRWYCYEDWTVKALIGDDWQTAAGATRKLIIEWDGVGSVTYTVMDGTTQIDTQTVTGITVDGTYLLVKIEASSSSDTSVAIDDLLLESTSSGTTYDESASDGVKISDSGSATVAMLCAATDALVASDATSGILLIPTSCSDQVDFQDEPSSLRTMPCSVADGVFLSDMAANIVTLLGNSLDGVFFSDATTNIATLLNGVLDGISLADFTTTGSLYDLSASDGLSCSDAVALPVLLIAVNASDGVTVQDLCGANHTVVEGVADGMAFLDAAGNRQIHVVQVEDGVELAEFVSALLPGSLPVKMFVAFVGKSGSVSFAAIKPNITFTEQ